MEECDAKGIIPIEKVLVRLNMTHGFQRYRLMSVCREFGLTAVNLHLSTDIACHPKLLITFYLNPSLSPLRCPQLCNSFQACIDSMADFLDEDIFLSSPLSKADRKVSVSLADDI